MPRAFWNELPVLGNDINDNARARVIAAIQSGCIGAGVDMRPASFLAARNAI